MTAAAPRRCRRSSSGTRRGTRRPRLPAARRAGCPAPRYLARRARAGPGRHVRGRAHVDPGAQRHRPLLAEPRAAASSTRRATLSYVPPGRAWAPPACSWPTSTATAAPTCWSHRLTATGYWPLSTDGGFDPSGYIGVGQAPTVSLSDPLVRLIDLDGDGVTDALRTGDCFELFYSDGGYVRPVQVVLAAEAMSRTSPSAIRGFSWRT